MPIYAFLFLALIFPAQPTSATRFDDTCKVSTGLSTTLRQHGTDFLLPNLIGEIRTGKFRERVAAALGMASEKIPKSFSQLYPSLVVALHQRNQGNQFTPTTWLQAAAQKSPKLRLVIADLLKDAETRGLIIRWHADPTLVMFHSELEHEIALNPIFELLGDEVIPDVLAGLAHELRHAANHFDWNSTRKETVSTFIDRYMPLVAEDELCAIEGELAMAKRLFELGIRTTILTQRAPWILALERSDRKAALKLTADSVTGIGGPPYAEIWKQDLEQQWIAEQMRLDLLACLREPRAQVLATSQVRGPMESLFAAALDPQPESEWQTVASRLRLTPGKVMQALGAK